MSQSSNTETPLTEEKTEKDQEDLQEYLQKELEKTRREIQLTHTLLDAADVPKGTKIKHRLVAIAKEWFRNHSAGAQDHISPKMRAILRAAGEGHWLDQRS